MATYLQVGLSAVAVITLSLATLAAQVTTLVSSTPGNQAGNGNSNGPVISADGKFIAFGSIATDLGPADGNPQWDVFIRDRLSGQTSVVSASLQGGPANGWSGSPALSSDGRFVAFGSEATNLVTSDTNGYQDVFLRDRSAGTTTLISVDSAGAQANGHSGEPSVSADGRYVAFSTSAPLVAADFNGLADIYVRDTMNGTTALQSVSTFGLIGDGGCFDPSLSDDGRYLVFWSDSQTLVVGDTNRAYDIFVRDLSAGVTTRVSVSSSGVQANSLSLLPCISGDGRYAAFASYASNLVGGDTNNHPDVFLHNLQSHATTRVSIAASGDEASSYSEYPSLSTDGRFIAFSSYASNLVPTDSNDSSDVFVHDRETSTTVLVSAPAFGGASDGSSTGSSISGDGRYVTFSAFAHLVASDGNPHSDAYLRDTFIPWTIVGSGVAGQLGLPSLAGIGTVQPLTVVAFSLVGAAPDAQAFLIVGLTAINAPFKGGTMIPALAQLFPMQTDTRGNILFSVLWPPSLPSGVSLFFQDWIDLPRLFRTPQQARNARGCPTWHDESDGSTRLSSGPTQCVWLPRLAICRRWPGIWT